MAGSARFVYSFNPGTTPRMAIVLMPLFHAALVRNLRTVADRIISDVQSHAVELQPAHVPYDLIPGGRDTGTMAESLVADLAESLSMVEYDFSSASAPYWEYIEFGHFYGSKWWDGYHFFHNAIERNKEAVMAAARQSWSEAVTGTHAVLGQPMRITTSTIALLSAKAL